MPLFRCLPLLPLILLTSLPLRAAEDWGLCSVPVISSPEPADHGPYPTEISAGEMLSEDRNLLVFSREVELKRNTQRITADELRYDRQREAFHASGNLQFSDRLFTLQADQLDYDSVSERGLFERTQFQLHDNHLRGEASRIEQLNASQRKLHDVRYTTCDPQQNHWSLSASTLQLDDASGMGTATHSVLRVGPLPLLYFPWFRFPITDQRISGVLPPTLSYSEDHGAMFSQPVYWNQAINYDMTITPFWYGERGLQLNTENRYLFAHHLGQLDLSWIDDDVFADERWFRRWVHQAELGAGIRGSLLLQKVSDSEYLQDFDHQEGIADVDYLHSLVQLTANLGGWSTRLRLDQHQTVDQSTAIGARPYRRLPQLTLDRSFTRADGARTLQWRNEFVDFDRDNSITGQRLHIAPTLSYPIEGDYFFVRPALQLDHTTYRLDNNSNGSNDISRSLPLASIDSGLFFERLAGRSGGWVQTLEPRLYLLYVPFEDQSTIPLLDSSLRPESYNNLFTNNRFTGRDRIGDARQLSLGLTTRLLDLTGREVLRASVGQAFYAADRRVSLSGNSIDEQDKSSLMSLLSYRPTQHWELQLNSVYDQQRKESKQTDIALRRHRGAQIFNLEYHLRENELEQSTLSLVYPHSLRWQSFFKVQRSIRNDKPVQNLLGLRYNSCCWQLDMLYEEESDQDFIETDRSVYFQLTFKGLGSAGNDVAQLLEDGILGYRRAN